MSCLCNYFIASVVACGLGAFLAVWLLKSRRRKQFHAHLDGIAQQVCLHDGDADMPWKVLNRLFVFGFDSTTLNILKWCSLGNYQRALTYLERISPKRRSVGLTILYLRLALRFGRRDLIEMALKDKQLSQIPLRLRFAANLGLSRWKEASALLEKLSQQSQSSLRERTLFNCLEKLAGVNVQDEELRLGRKDIFEELYGQDLCFDSSMIDLVCDALSRGVSDLEEMGAWREFKKRWPNCESPQQEQHLISEFTSRSDWHSLNRELLMLMLNGERAAGLTDGKADILLSRPERSLAYECPSCKVLYQPFHFICPNCWTMGIGNPKRHQNIRFDASSVSDCGVDLSALEGATWTALLSNRSEPQARRADRF